MPPRGGDPWQINQDLQDGDPVAINNLAEAFHGAGKGLKDADAQYDAAKAKFNENYSWTEHGTRTNENPINTSEQVKKMQAALKDHPEELGRIAVDLENVAVALEEAQNSGRATINDLNIKLHDIDQKLVVAMRELNTIDMLSLTKDATDATTAALDHMETLEGSYLGKLDVAEAAMMQSGYTPAVIDNIDGIPGNSPAEAAQRYEQSGQRQRDQELLDRARREGRTRTSGSWLDPEVMHSAELEAWQRLNDYTTVTHPDAFSDAEQARRQHLAGERLGDFNMANSTGPVPKDPVLGGDMRDRARARIAATRSLMGGPMQDIGGPHGHHIDEVTARVDQLELANRAQAVAGLQEALTAAGMDPQKAIAVVEDVARGDVPKEVLAGASAVDSAGGRIVKVLAAAGEAGDIPFSPREVDILKDWGKKAGMAGKGIDIITAAYDISNGADPFQTAAKTVSGWAATTAGAELGASMGAPLGPYGATVLGIVGGVGFGLANTAGWNAVTDILEEQGPPDPQLHWGTFGIWKY